VKRLLAALLALVALAAAAAPAAEAEAARGLQVVSSQRIDDRLTDDIVTSPALAAPVHVRILVPAGYAAHPRARYPVLYLLHGALADWRSWTDGGDAERITAGLDAIVVMPEGGNGGWYTNWFNGGAGGPPEWETFHIGRLIPWIDATYRTVARRNGRAIAGLSMGGFGAMSYAARHPDLFVWAASFSGAVDIIHNAPVAAVIAAEAPADGGKPDDQFGQRVADEIVWRAHNPWDLAGNLRGLVLTLDTGNGQPGPSDDPSTPFDPIEDQVRLMSVSLHQRLGALRIAHAWDDYEPGTHSWPYWQRDLERALPSLTATFAHPRRAPSPFTFTAAEPDYGAYGWRVRLHRARMAFSALADAGPRGFRLRDAGGHARVTTGPLYRPRSAHAVAVGRAAPRTLTADGRGRLRIDLRGGATVRIAARAGSPAA
jgi:diacylglycerol O-acyltransferase / trehalose O-mycolyltransferase